MLVTSTSVFNNNNLRFRLESEDLLDEAKLDKTTIRQI